MINIVIYYVLYIIFTIIIFINSKVGKINNVLVKCIGSFYNRTCIYNNIYYIRGKWIVINRYNESIKCVSIRSRESKKCWKPYVTNKNIIHSKVIYGLSTYIRLFYRENIGHLLWDDLYSLYLSFLKFNYKMEPFNIIISAYDNKWRNNSQTKIFEAFSMKKIIYEKEMKNSIFLIKQLIVGLAHHCQRCINNDYSIPGGKQYKATWWMRKRMYFAYKITNCKRRYGIIVNNKRFSEEDKIILHEIIEIFRNNITIRFIDWRNVKNFKRQLIILSCTSIYISGPGTGLLNFPFISDPGIVINLGTLYRGCPFYMEQYIEEGSPHFVSLYYPSNKRIHGLKKIEIAILVKYAIDILRDWSNFRIYHHSNLNIEAKIFKKLFSDYPKEMNYLLDECDWGKGVGFGIWAEKVIYFPNCYKVKFIADIVKNITAIYKNQLGCIVSSSKESCLN